MVASPISCLLVVVLATPYLLFPTGALDPKSESKIDILNKLPRNIDASSWPTDFSLNSPQPRSGACVWRDTISNKIWIFGGYATQPIDDSSRYLNDLYSWDLKTQSWQRYDSIQRQRTEKNRNLWPSPVSDAACWFVQSSQEFYFYEDNEFWKYSINSNAWTDIGALRKIKNTSTDANSWPGPITSVRLSWVDAITQTLYMFGGSVISEGQKVETTYDTWKYRIGADADESWQLISKGFSGNSPQNFDSSCSLSGDDSAGKVTYYCAKDSFEWVYTYGDSLEHSWSKIQKRRFISELASTPGTVPSDSPSQSGGQDSVLPIGAIAGIAVAAVLTVLLTVIVVFVCYQDSKSVSSQQQNASSTVVTDFSRHSSGISFKRSRNTSGYSTENKISVNESKKSTSIESSAASDEVSAFDGSDDDSSIMTDTTVTTDGSSGRRKHKMNYISRLSPSPKKGNPSLRSSKDSKNIDDESSSDSLSDTD